MRSEILIYLLISLFSATAQSVESENSTMEAILSSSLSSSLPIELKPNSEFEATVKSNSISEALEQNFLTQKLVETIAPRKKAFPLPEIKRARELGALDFAIPEREHSSSTSPFMKIDRNSTIKMQSDHPKYQNIAHEEGRGNYETKETSTSGLREISQLGSVIGSTTISNDETDGITEMPKHVENEEDTLPPEVRAADPFATTVTEELTFWTSSSSPGNILHIIQKINSFTTADFLNNSDDTPSETTNVEQTGALHGDLDTDAIDRTSSIIASSLKPEQETIITGTMDATEMALGIQEMVRETKVTIPEEEDTTAAFGTIILGTVPGIFPITAAGIVTPIKQITEIPTFHPVASRTFSAGSDEKAATTSQSEIITGGTTVDISWQSEKHLTESESAATSIEIEHKLEQPKIPTTSVELSSTTNEFNTDKTHENEHEQDDEHVHDDESLFVGDRTLFNQDGVTKQDFSAIHSTSEENFGVPGFSRIEGLGPEATEEIHQTEIDATTWSSTMQSLNSEFNVRAGIPIDLIKHSREHHNGENTSAKGSQTAAKSFEEGSELKDISVIDDSFYVHTDTEEAASTTKPTTYERKLEPEPTAEPEPTPETVLFQKSGVLKSSKASPEPVPGFEPKVEPEIAARFGNSKGNNDDFNDISHTHHHITDSDIAKEGAYKIPFSFHITSIDYIPEFGDPSSGKYKKLRDQLIPDLEEIFGSIFGNTYEGIRLVSFLKGSVAVDGVVYISTKPDDMEQSATEFEQQITIKNSQIGGNDVDPRSIVLDGYVSKNYVERIHEGYTSNSTSSYIVGGGLAIGVLAILLIAFTIIAGRKTGHPFMNNRRTNGTLKLKEENVAMAESSRSMWPNGTSPVNLMTYENGRMIHGGTTINTQPPMVMVGSQMTAVNTHATSRAIQPHV